MISESPAPALNQIAEYRRRRLADSHCTLYKEVYFLSGICQKITTSEVCLHCSASRYHLTGCFMLVTVNIVNIHTIPLSYTTDVLFRKTAQGLVQGKYGDEMAYLVQTYSEQDIRIRITVNFGTSR